MWNFAYGANMSPSKLEGARGLKPLESQPGTLPGWRLSFTHRSAWLSTDPWWFPGREALPAPALGPTLVPLLWYCRGGMGNLVQLRPGEAGPAGGAAVHGVLHRLAPADYARLCCCEHEYRPVEVEVAPYGGGLGRKLIRAVAFVTPEAATIQEGLPPPTRLVGGQAARMHRQ